MTCARNMPISNAEKGYKMPSFFSKIILFSFGSSGKKSLSF